MMRLQSLEVVNLRMIWRFKSWEYNGGVVLERLHSAIYLDIPQRFKNGSKRRHLHNT
jgi:hypothetical protein